MAEMKSAARQRWALLARALRSRHVPDVDPKSSVSVRRFTSFNLLPVAISTAQGQPYKIVTYTLPSGSTLSIREPYAQSVTASDLIGFDNTGNICVWPAEEVLAYYCAHRSDMFRSQKVCELGAGRSGLAGMAIAACGGVESVWLTDGNPTSVAALEVAVKDNGPIFAALGVAVTFGVVEWIADAPLPDGAEGSFGHIVCADCLYFRNHHEGLLALIDRLLAPKGVALLMAPSRGGTLDAFVSIVPASWSVTVEESYDDRVWSEHQSQLADNPHYDADLHYPKLVVLTRSSVTK